MSQSVYKTQNEGILLIEGLDILQTEVKTVRTDIRGIDTIERLCLAVTVAVGCRMLHHTPHISHIETNTKRLEGCVSHTAIELVDSTATAIAVGRVNLTHGTSIEGVADGRERISDVAERHDAKTHAEVSVDTESHRHIIKRSILDIRRHLPGIIITVLERHADIEEEGKGVEGAV